MVRYCFRRDGVVAVALYLSCDVGWVGASCIGKCMDA